VNAEDFPIIRAEGEGEFGDFGAHWKDVDSNVANGQLCFGDVELNQVGAFSDEDKGFNWDPVAAIEVARAEERVVQVLLKEFGQLRSRFTQR